MRSTVLLTLLSITATLTSAAALVERGETPTQCSDRCWKLAHACQTKEPKPTMDNWRARGRECREATCKRPDCSKCWVDSGIGLGDHLKLGVETKFCPFKK